MKPFPRMETTAHKKIFDLIRGKVRTHILLSAVELGIFDRLSSPISGEKVAAQLNTHGPNTIHLLDGLAALGLISKKNGLYQNTRESELTLKRQSEVYLGDLVRDIDAWSKDTIDAATLLVRNGPEPRSRCSKIGEPETWRQFARSLANYQRSGFAQDMAERVSALDGFAACRKMLDLGGGPGLVCLAIVDKHPTMTGVIFDRPMIAEAATEYVAEYGMRKRVEVMAGDYTEDAIGTEYDLVWASATLCFAKNNIEALLTKIHDALNPGGIFISLSEGMTDEGTGPEPLIMDCMAYLLSGQNIFFHQGEISAALQKVGFASVERRTIDTPIVRMDMDIARKQS